MRRGYVRVPNWLADTPDLSPSAKVVFVLIASHVNTAGVSWPSQRTLSARMGVSLATVERAISALRTAGLLTVERARTGRGSRNEYRLLVALDGTVPDWIEQGGVPSPVRGGVPSLVRGALPSESERLPRSEAVSEPVSAEQQDSVEQHSEKQSPTTLSSRPQVVDAHERRGRMTDSWKPTTQAFGSAESAYPKVNVTREVTTFRAWHQSKPAVDKTQGEWDNLFVTWCGRKQEQWEAANPPSEEDPWDPVTGMPKHPKQRPNPRPEERVRET